jgi:hypothetical protein
LPEQPKKYLWGCSLLIVIFFCGTTILTFYRTYKFTQMEHICLHQRCNLEIQNHNIFETSLLNQLDEDRVSFTKASCNHKVVIWKDSLADGSNNMMCLSD